MSSSATTISVGTTPVRYWMTVPSFLLGSMIALLSQFVLQYIFYGINAHFVQQFLYTSSNDANLSLLKVLCFSITWSFSTCIMVFFGMLAVMQVLESIFTIAVSEESSSFVATKSSTASVTKNDDDEETDDAMMFAMELAYVFGAIVAIILMWTVYDFGVEIHPPTPSSHTDHSYIAFLMRQSPLVTVLLTTMITLLVLSTITAMFHMASYWYIKCFPTRKAENETAAMDVEDVTKDADRNNMMMSLSIAPSPTEWIIYCIASTVGLLIGMGTQVLLSLLLWNNVNRIPYVVQSNFTIALFSFGWSTITVIATALACYLLRVFVFHYIVQNYMHRNLSFHYKSLLIVRMEAMYIGWTLTGICVGWIILDVVHHMTSQIYISIMLFILSLSSFGCILYYFPEEADDTESDSDGASTTLTEPLLLTEDVDEIA